MVISCHFANIAPDASDGHRRLVPRNRRSPPSIGGGIGGSVDVCRRACYWSDDAAWVHRVAEIQHCGPGAIGLLQRAKRPLSSNF